MRWRWLAAMVAIVGVMVSCSRPGGTAAAASASAVAWEKDLATALGRAGSEGKVVMVDFYTDWCGWCKKLDETTLADPTVQARLRRVVAVKLDAERDGRAEAARYRVDGFPTVIFLDAKGVEVARIPGYLPPGEFLEELEDVLGRA